MGFSSTNDDEAPLRAGSLGRGLQFADLGSPARIAGGLEGLSFGGIRLRISRLNLAGSTKFPSRLPVLAEFHPAGSEVETAAKVLGIHLDGTREILCCFRVITARKIGRAKEVVSKALIRQSSRRFLEVSQGLVVAALEIGDLAEADVGIVRDALQRIES